MTKLLYTLFAFKSIVIKSLYGVKSKESRSQRDALAFTMFILNSFSILSLIDYYLKGNLGIIYFWKPSSVPKILYVFIIGPLFFIPYYFSGKLVQKRISGDEKKAILRRIRAIRSKKLIAISYITITVLIFIWMFFVVAHSLSFGFD